MTTAGRPLLAEEFDLAPHPEGGWYRRTWHSEHCFTPAGYDGPRSAASAIYFALHLGEESQWHVVRSTELWLWHRGGPLTVRLGGVGDQPGLEVETVTLGLGQRAGERPQLIVPGGTWQCAAPVSAATLVTCVVAPGFDFADFRLA